MISFFLARGWSASSGQAGISAFEEARAANLSPIATDGSVDLVLAPRPSTPTGRPDFSLWAASRIREYERSIQLAGDAPRAVLTIEHLNIRVPVYDGATEFNLNRGVARVLGTARVGEGGNLAIAGHRDGFFRPLKDIRLGDRFVVETYRGSEEYAVTSIQVVDPGRLEVLAPTDTPTVTLVTCFPFYHVGPAPQRFIVRGEATGRQMKL